VLKYNQETDINCRTVSLKKHDKVPTPAKAVIGFIGAGNYAGGVLVPAFASTSARLKTIASAGGVSGTQLGNKFGFETSTTDISLIFSDPEINTVVITTRHDSHASLVIKALENGKHVFVEKPLCLTFAELKEIERVYKEACDKQPVHLMVGFNRRFSPLIASVREKLKAVNSARSIIITVNAGHIPAEHWSQDDLTGGGRIAGEACHFIDLFRCLAEQPITSITTMTMPAENPDQIPDTVTISLACANGSIGTVHYFANGSKDFPKERIELFCAGKIMQIDNFRNLNYYGWSGMRNQSLWTQDKGQTNCVTEFVNAIEKGAACPISIEEIFEVANATLVAAGNTQETDQTI
jgi:predicted dehydrogenase